MRRLSEILKLPVSELTDEEICKAAMSRLNSRMCALAYRGDDGNVYWIYRFKDKAGRFFWNKIQIALHKLWDHLDIKVHSRFQL